MSRAMPATRVMRECGRIPSSKPRESGQEGQPLYLISAAVALTGTGSTIQQSSPEAEKFISALPPRDARVRLTRREPNPRRAGGVTGGPPVSSQRKFTNCSAPLFSTDQDTSNCPAGEDRTPYLAALVPSSWKTMLRATAGPCGMNTGGPFRITRLDVPPKYGDN